MKSHKYKNNLDEVVFVVFAYNQEHFLLTTLESAIKQTMCPHKLIIMDDASSDDTREIVEDILVSAPEDLSVEYNRNKNNLGLVAQINTVMSRFKDKLVVIQAGDDESYPNRLELIYEEWLNAGKPALVLANYDAIDSDGQMIRAFSSKHINRRPYDIKNILNRKAMVYGCSAAFTYELWRIFGPIPEGVINEDRVNVFRAFLLNSLIYINKPLVRYRSTVGISAFSVDSKKKRLHKLLIEAERELIDLDCYSSDLMKVSRKDLKPLIDRRIKEVKWLITLSDGLNLKSLLKGLMRGISFRAIRRVYKKLSTR